MKKSTFLEYDTPLLTCMVQADNPDRIKELISKAKPEGAEAFGMQFCRMKPEYRNKETYRELFDFASPLPVYVTNYREHGYNKEKSDEILASELLELAECGATLCDVMGDYFDPTEDRVFGIDVARKLADRQTVSRGERELAYSRGKGIVKQSSLNARKSERIVSVKHHHGNTLGGSGGHRLGKRVDIGVEAKSYVLNVVNETVDRVKRLGERGLLLAVHRIYGKRGLRVDIRIDLLACLSVATHAVLGRKERGQLKIIVEIVNSRVKPL